MLESIRPLNGELDDIFIDLRKSLMKEFSNIGYKYIYSQTEGMWATFSEDAKISKDTLLLADNGQGGFDVYDNKVKKTNQVLTIDPNSQIIMKRGQLLIYTPQCLQIGRVEYSYGNFVVKTLSSKSIKQYFPDTLIINVDNIGMNAVQVTKTTAKQTYMLISHAGSNFDGYTLTSDIPVQKGELSNMFTIDSTNTVNVQWNPPTADGKQYTIVFVTDMTSDKEDNPTDTKDEE